MKPAIIKRSALLLALACVLALLGAPRASAANQVADIRIKAALQDDGSADITQTWTATTDEGTEFYLACRDNGYLSITDFTVSDEQGTYEPLASWDVGADFTQKARKCGVVETGEGVELCWGISEYGTHTYTLRDGKIIYSKGNDHIIDAVRCAMLIREEGNLDPVGEEVVSLKPVLTNPVFI